MGKFLWHLQQGVALYYQKPEVGFIQSVWLHLTIIFVLICEIKTPPAPRHTYTHRHHLHHLLEYVYNAGPGLRAQRPKGAWLTEPRHVAKSQALFPQNHCLGLRIFFPNVWLQLPFEISASSFPKNLPILSHKSIAHSQERVSVISS